MTTIQLAERIDRIKPSATLAVSQKANVLKASGKDILNLSVGEPDFDTPVHIKQAAIEALKQGFTKYTPTVGTLSLRKAICEKLSKENHINYDPKQIVVSCGAKQSLFNLTQVLLNPGDEVILPAPFWSSYAEMVLLVRGKPVIIPTKKENRFILTADELRAHITPKTRLIMLNSPNNPSGMVYSLQDWQAIAEVLLEHPNIIICTDDIYEKIIWNHLPFTNILNACPDLYDRTVIINGVSKAYAMTGWRIGYAAGPQTIMTAMEKIQSQCTSGPNSIAQYAAECAILSSQQCVSDMVVAFKERHDFALNKVNAISGLHSLAADGAFYLFIDAHGAMDKLGMQDDIVFAEYLLSEAEVAVVPGSAFAVPGFFRLSIATDIATIDRAIKQIAAVIK